MMKVFFLALGTCLFVGDAQAQQPVGGSRSQGERLRQERRLDDSVLRHGSRDARQLDQLQRLRQRSQDRAQRLRQPSQPSRPANAKNYNKNTVVTQ